MARAIKSPHARTILCILSIRDGEGVREGQMKLVKSVQEINETLQSIKLASATAVGGRRKAKEEEPGTDGRYPEKKSEIINCRGTVITF